MIDLLVNGTESPSDDRELLRQLELHAEAVERSARQGDVRQVHKLEAAVKADPSASFSFDQLGFASLNIGEQCWSAGLFAPLSIRELKTKAAATRSAVDVDEPRIRLLVIDGGSAPTDIGSLQAAADNHTLFQVASQFNCLEAPGPFVTPVERYLGDSTQGPRASISALPGTLLRHYAAPGINGERFVQLDSGPQIELLADVCDPNIARVVNGYLRADEIRAPRSFLATLEARFDSIRVGVHEDVEVVLGYDWAGAVEQVPRPRIGQVFTSTLAGGGYGQASGIFEDICRQLLRASYFGTLLAAISLGRSRVVLTLIGGGVFGNPVEVIWEAITWALDRARNYTGRDLTVVVNGRDIAQQVGEDLLLQAVRKHCGLLLSWRRGAKPTLVR